MADNNNGVRAEDLLPVRTRISWGAIFAGVMVALPLYFLLTLLGAAIGLSVHGRVRAENIATGAAVWAIASTLISLFVGGFVASQCTVGENKGEAALYGVIVWGVVFGMLLWLTATGVRAGFHAMVGLAANGQTAPRDAAAGDWEAMARKAGVSPQTLEAGKRDVAATPGAANRAAQEARAQQAVEEGATQVAWWALVGTLLSMLAAVGGALVGAGPTLRLVRRFAPSSRLERPEPVGRL
jgi:hypothetical protein